MTGMMEPVQAAIFVAKSDDNPPPNDILATHHTSRGGEFLGDIAQLVERLVRNEKVRGSNPLISTRFSGA